MVVEIPVGGPHGRSAAALRQTRVTTYDGVPGRGLERLPRTRREIERDRPERARVGLQVSVDCRGAIRDGSDSRTKPSSTNIKIATPLTGFVIEAMGRIVSVSIACPVRRSFVRLECHVFSPDRSAIVHPAASRAG